MEPRLLQCWAIQMTTACQAVAATQILGMQLQVCGSVDCIIELRCWQHCCLQRSTCAGPVCSMLTLAYAWTDEHSVP